jgi:hypothetical protein
MRIGRSEALDLLSKWALERTLLECVIELPVIAARFRARLSSADGELVRLMSDDTTSELAFSLLEVVDIGYGDTRGFESADEFDGILVFFF